MDLHVPDAVISFIVPAVLILLGIPFLTGKGFFNPRVLRRQGKNGKGGEEWFGFRFNAEQQTDQDDQLRFSSIGDGISPASSLAVEVAKEPDFPDDWWTSEELFALEQRALFVKSWLLLTHTHHFTSPGTYHTISHPSGYPIFLILGRDHILRGFHNICRHRAYPVVSSKKSGCSLVLGCKYHGWSYDSRGRLVKAPKFDGVQGFEKEKNGLFEIGVKVNEEGGVSIGLGCQVTNQDNEVKKAEGKVVDSWEVEGTFNWKLAESNDAFDIPALMMANHGNTTFGQLAVALGFQKTSSQNKPSILTHIFTSPSLNMRLVVTVLPTSPTASTIQASLSAISSKPINLDILPTVKDQLLQSIRSLESTYSEIKLSGAIPDTSSQKHILSHLKAHRRRERLAGKQIRPTAGSTVEVSGIGQAAVDLCKELESAAGCNNGRKRDFVGNGLNMLDW